MHDLKKLDRAVLENMILAHSANSKRLLSEEEFNVCKKIIKELKAELASRTEEPQPGKIAKASIEPAKPLPKIPGNILRKRFVSICL